MRVYLTSCNTGPTWSGPDPVHVKYLGTNILKADAAVGDFRKYWKEQHPSEHRDLYTALPRGMIFEFVQYYMADGWWYSIVAFNLVEE